MRSDSTEIEEHRDLQNGAWLYLEEITHRALNDYTAMLAIVRRAAETAPDEISARALTEVGTRLRASAMTYLALRPPQGEHDCDLSEELAALCSFISNAILSPRGIRLSLSAEPVTICAFRCWQISLVVSELIINAARHAFGRHASGAVTVRMCVGAESLLCEIADDGGTESAGAPGRGTAIVNALIGDLGGTITREHFRTGSTIMFRVPLLTDAERLPNN